MSQASAWSPELVRWDAPVLVTSASRSGSTLLRNVLNSHPELAISRESYFGDFLKLCSVMAGVQRGQTLELPGLSFVGILEEHYRSTFMRLQLAHSKQLVEEFYLESFAGKEFTRWGDQFHSTFAIPEIVLHYPHAQFIHLVRDGRDRLVSALRYHERRRKEETFLEETTVEKESEYWTHINRDLFDLLEGGRGSVVHYEDLIREPGRTLEGAAEFLGIEVAPAMLEYLNESAAQFFGRHSTSTSPEASIGRWRHELTEDQRRVANEVMGPMLARAGYDVD